MMALVAVPELPQKLHSIQGVMFIKQVLSPSVHVKLRESNRTIGGSTLTGTVKQPVKRGDYKSPVAHASNASKKYMR